MVYTSEACNASFSIEQKTGLIDEAIKIGLAGVIPNQLIKIKASMRDNFGHRWESYALFRANHNGEVNLETQCPIEGTYSIIDKMGLFWSMKRQSLQATKRTPLEPIKTVLTAEVNGQIIASTKIIRNVKAPDVERIQVQENGLVGTFFVPRKTERLPGVIVFGGSEGGLFEGRAAMLASHGFAALALAYFGKDHLPKQLLNIPLEYIGKALSWMDSQPVVNSDRLAVLGTSKGGELALLSGSQFPQIRAVVAVVPSGVVFRGIGKNEDENIPSSWAINGVPHPFAQGSIPQEVLDDIDREISSGKPVRWVDWYRSQLSDLNSVQKAMIRVENIKGPILLVSGGDDQVWPSGYLSKLVIDRLEQFKHPFEYTHLYYPNAGHAIVQPYYPTTDRDGFIALGGSPAEDALAQGDSWAKIIDFLKKSF